MREDLVEQIFEPLLRPQSPYTLLNLLREKRTIKDRSSTLSVFCGWKNGAIPKEYVRWSTGEAGLTLLFGDSPDDRLVFDWPDVLNHLQEGTLFVDLLLEKKGLVLEAVPENHPWWVAYKIYPYSRMNTMSGVREHLERRGSFPGER